MAGSETPARLFKNTPAFTEHPQWLILTFLGFQSATLLKKRLRHRCFSVNFANFLRTSFDRTPSDDASCVYLRILRSCSDHLFHRVTQGNFLFQVQVAGFQPPDTGKKYFTSAFQAFYTRTRSSYSKARSSHKRCHIRKGVLRNFVKFTGKHLCRSLFLNKVAGLSPATLIKRDSGHRCFPVNLTKFLRTTLLQNTSGRLLLEGVHLLKIP